MEETTITEDREVEVCTEEEGFEGAWFSAFLEEDPTGRRKVRVRYSTLLAEDGLSPVTEIIDPKLIRPVPPENLYSGVVLEEGMVVDAYRKDAWWTGLVIKKKPEDDIYLVSFEPPDILQFERKLLRAHLQWAGSEWVLPDIQELDKSMFCSGTMVEVCSDDKGEIAWFPAMIVKDGEEKSIVKYCKKHLRSYNDEVAGPTETVDTCRVRPTPPPCSVEEYGLVERVEVFHGSAWRQGIVRFILSERRYRVSLKATKVEFVFKHSDLRPIKVWEDGVWRNGARCRQSVSLVAAEAARSKAAGKKEKLPIETADQSRDDKRAADKRRKRKREEKQRSDLKETDKTCNGSNADEVKVLEWAAVGMMAGYNRLLEEFKALKPDDSTSTFNRFNVSFAELEKHGFDVADPQSRIRKVLSLKDGLAKLAEERICAENKFEEAEREKRKVQEEIAELKRKILELERREAIADEEKEAAEKLMVEMKSNAETTEQEMQEILSAPW